MKFCLVVGVILIGCGLVAPARGFSLSSVIDDTRRNFASDEAANLFGYDIEINTNETSSDFSPDDDIFFELYTPDNPNELQLIQLGNESTLTESNFNNTNPTRIVIHGWKSNEKFTPTFVEAYFEKGKHKVNLIAVNWLAGAETLLYYVARGRVKMIGAHLAKFIAFLVECGGMKYSDLSIIGHSLAGKSLKNGRLPKIVGLDPARILFSLSDAQNRLTHTDADYVEVIHTSAGRLAFTQPIGQVDFYPNGGQLQPGCGLDLTGRCSHRRAWELYAESIYNAEFAAFGCDSFHNLEQGLCKDRSLMGGEPGNGRIANGVFYLHTNESPPFALGQEGVSRSLPSVEKSTFWDNLFSVNQKKQSSQVAQFIDEQFDRLLSWRIKLR